MEEKNVENKTEQFTYTYSSREQDEIKKIREVINFL